MAPSLSGDYLKGLLDLKSMGAVVMILSLDHRFIHEWLLLVQHSQKSRFSLPIPGRAYQLCESQSFGGDHIVYIGDYLEVGHEYFHMTAQELLQRFIPGIKRINPEFDERWVKKIWVNSTNYAQPVPMLNHSRNIPAIKTPIPGLFFASMSQVYPWDRGTNFAVEIGRRAAGMMEVESRIIARFRFSATKRISPLFPGFKLFLERFFEILFFFCYATGSASRFGG